MLKQQARLLSTLAIILDLLVVIVSFVLAHHLRNLFFSPSPGISDYLWFLLGIIPVWFVSLNYFGLYESLRTKRTSQVLASLAKAHLAAAVIASAVVYFVEPHFFGRMLLLLFVVIAYFTLAFGKLTLRVVLYYFRRRGYNFRNLLLVGSGTKAADFIRLVEKHSVWGLRIIGIMGVSGTGSGLGNTYPFLGEPEDVIGFCRRETVDEVVFCLSANELGSIDAVVYELNQMGITSRMVLDIVDFPASRREISIFHDELPMLTFYSTAFDTNQLFVKRLLDIVGSTFGLILMLILLPVIALAIKLDSPGPVFFGQERVGENRRRFLCWKFRSMYLDAEERKKDLAAANEMQGHMFKIKYDPRITRVGHFLRKTSLDELPQFWNVLRGEMSLVGTRPPTPDEVDMYEAWHLKRISIKPGITGLWQVSGRNDIQDFDQIVRLDIQYIDNWTLWIDIKLLLKTVWVVFACKGAR
jgi:exopolysaccharide biosynthesis polyprenyl glycosylphosphotransferase